MSSAPYGTIHLHPQNALGYPCCEFGTGIFKQVVRFVPYSIITKRTYPVCPDNTKVSTSLNWEVMGTYSHFCNATPKLNGGVMYLLAGLWYLWGGCLPPPWKINVALTQLI